MNPSTDTVDINLEDETLVTDESYVFWVFCVGIGAIAGFIVGSILNGLRAL